MPVEPIDIDSLLLRILSNCVGQLQPEGWS